MVCQDVGVIFVVGRLWFPPPLTPPDLLRSGSRSRRNQAGKDERESALGPIHTKKQTEPIAFQGVPYYLTLALSSPGDACDEVVSIHSVGQVLRGIVCVEEAVAVLGADTNPYKI